MSSNYKISLIIPCFNSSKYLKRCMDSIIGQTITIEHLEIILIDDGSTDHTFSLLEQYESKYPENIMLISLEQNMGQGYARNLALSYATGKYILFVDSDDCIQYQSILYLSEVMEQGNYDVIEFDVTRDYDEFLSQKSYTLGDIKNNLQTFEVNNDAKRRLFCTTITKYGLTCNKIYTRTLLTDNNIFFAEGLLHEDTIFSELLLLYAKHYGYINIPFYYYHLNPNGSMQKQEVNDVRQFERMKVQMLFLEECEKRSLFTKYFDIIETLFIKIYYIDTMLSVLLNFTETPLEQINEMQKTVLTCFPNYRQNYLLNTTKTELESILLKTIVLSFDDQSFKNLKNDILSLKT